MLTTKNVAFTYGDKQMLSFPDIHCKKGEQWLLLGQSGSGKSTFLHLLAGLMRPNRGVIGVAGQDITRLSQSQLDHFRGKHIGIVFQKSHFIRSLTVLENLLLAQHLAGEKLSKERGRELLERLKIDYKQHAKPDKLSQGEQQRLAIARALVNKPDLILADEPTSALDDMNCDEVLLLLEDQAHTENATLLIVTHDGRLKDKLDKQINLERSEIFK